MLQLLVLHPDGLSARLANLAQVRGLFLERLGRQVGASGDAELAALYEEVSAYPQPAGAGGAETEAGAPPSPFEVPIRIRTPVGELSMFSTMATFGAPADVMLSEPAIELFYPLDDFTAAALREAAAVAKA